MKKSRPIEVTLIAILQFIPALLLPPELLLSINPIMLLILLAFFAFLCWAMLTLKRWALMLCIFVQGFNVIARFLIMFPHATDGEGVDLLFVITSLLGILLSTFILYVVDRPRVDVAFTA
jgi:zinc transporter ZupT